MDEDFFLHRMEVLCQAYLYPFKIFFINIKLYI